MFMRIARIIGTVTMNRMVAHLKPGRFLLAETLDHTALSNLGEQTPRSHPMPESLIIFDQLGAGLGHIVAVSEGGEASMPFKPQPVAIDAYCSAILDEVTVTNS